MENNANSLFDIIQSIASNLNSSSYENANSNTNINQNFKNENTNNLNIMDILNGLNLKSNNQTAYNNENNNTFDISNVIKIQKIISNFNQEDPRKKFLISIKPFLRKTRQEKIDEYITYLSLIAAIDIFTEKKE